MIQNDYNVLLVEKGVRPAMLVQPADYGEATGKDPKTKAFLDKVKKEYPHLIHSEDYEPYQGIIVSRKKYKGTISLEEMGTLLGYPCSKEFNDPKYSVELVLHKEGKTMQLLANHCTHPNLQEFKQLAKKAQDALGIEVKVVVTKIISTDHLLKKCIQHKVLNPEEKDKIQNILFNFGFSMKIQFYFMDSFQYHNPIHRGILIDLLLKEKNDILSPFYPLQHHVEHARVNSIIEQYEKDLIDILEKTKIKQSTKKRGVRLP
jgi:predicted nucleotidyltransferase